VVVKLGAGQRSCFHSLWAFPGVWWPLGHRSVERRSFRYFFDTTKREKRQSPAKQGFNVWYLERAKGTAPGHQLVYYEHFFRSRRHGMDSIVDSSLRPGQRRPLRVIQSEPSTSINSQSIGFHSEVYPSTGTPRHRPQRTGELRPQRTGLSSTGEASSFTRARNRFMGSEGSPRRRSR
jgi:hypothetical protein